MLAYLAEYFTASEVTTSWLDRNACIIIIIMPPATEGIIAHIKRC